MNTSNASKTSPLYIGRRVTFTRFGKVAIGTVVKETIFSWCSGANSVTVVDDETSHLVSLPTACGMFKEIPGVGAEIEIASARRRYQAALSVYPIWAERFAAGASVGF